MLRPVPLPKARDKSYSLDSLDGLTGFAGCVTFGFLLRAATDGVSRSLAIDEEEDFADACEADADADADTPAQSSWAKPLTTPDFGHDYLPSEDFAMECSPASTPHPSPTSSRSPTPYLRSRAQDASYYAPFASGSTSAFDATATATHFSYALSNPPTPLTTASRAPFHAFRRSVSSGAFHTPHLPSASSSTHSLASEAGTAATGLALHLRKRDRRFADSPSPPPSPPTAHADWAWPAPDAPEAGGSEAAAPRRAPPPRKKARTRANTPPSPRARVRAVAAWGGAG